MKLRQALLITALIVGSMGGWLAEPASAQEALQEGCFTAASQPIQYEVSEGEQVIVRFDDSCLPTFERSQVYAVEDTDVGTADSSTNCNGRQVHNDPVDLDLTWLKLNYTYGWNGASIIWANGAIPSWYTFPDGWQYNYHHSWVTDEGYFRYPYAQANFEFSPSDWQPQWEHYHHVHMTVSGQGTCRATFSYTGSVVPGGYICGHVWRDRPRPGGVC